MPQSFIDVSETGSGPIDRLRETITEFNQASAKQTAEIVRLTRVLVVLTVLLFVGLAVQIGVAILVQN
jgi:hypothetical protein